MIIIALTFIGVTCLIGACPYQAGVLLPFILLFAGIIGAAAKLQKHENA